MDWDPSALKLQKEIDARNSFLHFCAAESDLFSDITSFQVALNATLRHYPHEPGLLLLKNDIGDTPFQLARKKFGKEKTWTVITECLEESNGCKILLEKNPETNLFPVMLAAAGDSSELDIVYYLVGLNPLNVMDCVTSANV
jgi:hypothetical protein